MVDKKDIDLYIKMEQRHAKDVENAYRLGQMNALEKLKEGIEQTDFDFESKDYAKCVIEELEKIKSEIDVMYDSNQYSDEFEHGIMRVREIINNHISKLKGDTNDRDN